MERLTKLNKQGTDYYYPTCFQTCDGDGYSEKCDDCNFENKICNKLGEYEDLEEQGLLLKLPCKVGDIVYRICGTKGNHYVGERKVVSITIHRYSITISTTRDDTLGKKIFLTREEAEAKLEELRGK